MSKEKIKVFNKFIAECKDTNAVKIPEELSDFGKMNFINFEILRHPKRFF